MKFITLSIKLCLALTITYLPMPTLISMQGDIPLVQIIKSQRDKLMADILTTLKDASKTADDLDSIIKTKARDAKISIKELVDSSINFGRDDKKNIMLAYSFLLHQAVEHSTVEKLKKLISLKANLEARDSNDLTPLNKAIKLQKLPQVCCLLDAESDIYAAEKYGDLTAVGLAIATKNHLIILEILGSKMCATTTNKKHGIPPLKKETELFLKIDPLIKHLNYCSSLCKYQLTETQKMSQVEVPENSIDNNTPLHSLAFIGKVECIKHVTIHRPDYHTTFNNGGYNPIHVATLAACDSVKVHNYIRPRFIETIKLLIECDPASLHYKTIHGFTPLHLACGNKNIELVELFLRLGANSNTVAVNGDTPRTIAKAQQCDIDDLIKNIQTSTLRARKHTFDEITKKIDAQVSAEELKTTIITSSETLSITPRELVNTFNVITRTATETTQEQRETLSLLHYIIEWATVEHLKTLIDLGAYLDYQDSHGFTPLQKAIRLQQLDFVRCLLDHGSDIHLKNTFYKIPLTALGLAIGIASENINETSMRIVEEILGSEQCHFTKYSSEQHELPDLATLPTEFAATINAIITHLKEYCRYFSPEDNDMLLDEQAILPKALAKSTPLHTVAALGKVECINDAYENASWRTKHYNDNGHMPIHVATLAALKSLTPDSKVHPRRLETIKLLLTLEPKSIDYTTSTGLTPLHLTCQAKNLELIELFLNRHANPDAVVVIDKQEETPRTLADKLGFKNQFEKIIFKPTIDELSKSMQHMSINRTKPTCPDLCAAAIWNKPELIDYLLAHGANPETELYQGKNALLLALENRRHPFIQRLLIDPVTKRPRAFTERLINTIVMYKDDNGEYPVTALYSAITFGDDQATEILLSCGAKTGIDGKCGNFTPLQVAQYNSERNPEDLKQKAIFNMLTLREVK